MILSLTNVIYDHENPRYEIISRVLLLSILIELLSPSTMMIAIFLACLIYVFKSICWQII